MQCCIAHARTTLSSQYCLNIALKKYLCNVGPRVLYNVALICLSQHKKITFAMLARHPLTMMHRKIICNFTWIYLGQHYIRKVLVQCWPRVLRYTFAGIPAFSNMSGGLFFNGVHYYQIILALMFNAVSGIHLQLAGQQLTGANIDWNICYSTFV